MTRYAPHMAPKLRSPQIMAAAMGMPCTLRISSFVPGHQCAGADTTVACHLEVNGKGTSTKVTDLATAFGCVNCHAILDGAAPEKYAYIIAKYPAAFASRMLNGLIETQTMLIEEGIIQINDSRMEWLSSGPWR